MTIRPPSLARWCAAALLVAPDGRYLMQLRDDDPAIFIPDHWGLFGGTVDLGESGEQALRRELFEELEFTANAVTLFTEMVIELPFDPVRVDRMSFYVVPIADAELGALVQHEGAAHRLFTADDLAAEPRAAPWDLAAVLMHARRATLFPPSPATAD